jgi:hypothetical protein
VRKDQFASTLCDKQHPADVVFSRLRDGSSYSGTQTGGWLAAKLTELSIGHQVSSISAISILVSLFFAQIATANLFGPGEERWLIQRMHFSNHDCDKDHDETWYSRLGCIESTRSCSAVRLLVLFACKPYNLHCRCSLSSETGRTVWWKKEANETHYSSQYCHAAGCTECDPPQYLIADGHTCHGGFTLTLDVPSIKYNPRGIEYPLYMSERAKQGCDAELEIVKAVAVSDDCWTDLDDIENSKEFYKYACDPINGLVTLNWPDIRCETNMTVVDIPETSVCRDRVNYSRQQTLSCIPPSGLVETPVVEPEPIAEQPPLASPQEGGSGRAPYDGQVGLNPQSTASSFISAATSVIVFLATVASVVL